MREAMFKRTDTDGSGGLSKTELTASLADRPQGGPGAPTEADLDKVFAQIDSDGNGEISTTEDEAALKSFAPPVGGEASAGQSDPRNDALAELLKALEEASDPTKAKSDKKSPQQAVQQLVEQFRHSGESASLFSFQA